MKTRLSIDRFEGDKKEVAVLRTEDGMAIKTAIDGGPRRTPAATAWITGPR